MQAVRQGPHVAVAHFADDVQRMGQDDTSLRRSFVEQRGHLIEHQLGGDKACLHSTVKLLGDVAAELLIGDHEQPAGPL